MKGLIILLSIYFATNAYPIVNNTYPMVNNTKDLLFIEYTNLTNSAFVQYSPPRSRSKKKSTNSTGRGSACFSENMNVLSNNNIISMKDLKINDEIYGYNIKTNSLEMTKVIAWLHRDITFNNTYIKLHTNSDYLIISKEHNLAIYENNTIKYIFSEQVKLGDKLILDSNSYKTIEKIEYVKDIGLYAPLTLLGNFYVGYNEFHLVHSFAYVRNPEFYHPLFTQLLNVYNLLYPNSNILTNDVEYIHPMAESMMKYILA